MLHVQHLKKYEKHWGRNKLVATAQQKYRPINEI
jgi:hypothetical protein